jgi:Flp pilus assembly protein CpaB
VAAALGALAPTPAPGRAVLVAARDVPAGAALQAGDLTRVSRPPSDLPVAAVTEVAAAVGRVVATPLQSGEVLTPARLLGHGLLSGRPAGEVAVPVRIADGPASALLGPGSRVDVLVAQADAVTASARTVARGATVLAVPGHLADGADGAGPAGGLLGTGGADPTQGGLLLLAVPASTAADLAQAAVVGPLSFLIR